MDALDYEFLIRRIYHSGRTSKNGANADIYRKVETSLSHLNDPMWKKTQEQKNYDYASAFAEVRMYVRDAIAEGINKIRYRVSTQDLETLNAMQEKLHELHFYDKVILDEMIETADDIFNKNGLKAA